jgi:hypothetical protein
MWSRGAVDGARSVTNGSAICPLDTEHTFDYDDPIASRAAYLPSLRMVCRSEGGRVLEVLQQRALALLHALRSFDCSDVSGDSCVAVVKLLAQVEKGCAAARASAAAKAADCGSHRREGFREPDDWLSRETGTTRGEARDELDTARALDDMPATRDATRSGELSLKQAKEVASAARANPGSEDELLAKARDSSLSGLRDTARRKRHERVDRDQLLGRQRRARGFRHWRDELGMVCFSGAVTPDVGVPFVNRLDAETARCRRAARKQGIDEAWEAYAADAFVHMTEGGGTGRSRSADVVVVIDLRAYRRGHTHGSEPCHIVGGGPVPVSVARQMTEDAFVKAVVHDGVGIKTVRHFGRHIKAELRTALELGEVPELDGVTCCEPGCDRRYHLEWDHVDPVAHDGPTCLENLRPRCWPHHVEKSERDRKAGLWRPP